MSLRRYPSSGQLSSLLTHAGGYTTAPRPIGFAARPASYSSHDVATPTSHSSRPSSMIFGHGAQPWSKSSAANSPSRASSVSTATLAAETSIADARWDEHRRRSGTSSGPSSAQVKSTLASWLDSQYGPGTSIGHSDTSSQPQARPESSAPSYTASRRDSVTTPWSNISSTSTSLSQPASSLPDTSTIQSRPGILKTRPVTTSGSFTDRLYGPLDRNAWTDLSESDYTNVSKLKGRRINPATQTTELKQLKLEEAHFAGLAMATQLSSTSSIAKFLKSVANDNYRRSIAEGTSYFKRTQGDSIFKTQNSLFDYTDATERSLGEILQDARAVRIGQRMPSSTLQSIFESYARTHRGGRSLIDRTLQRGFRRSYKMTSEESNLVQSTVDSARARYLNR